jgi:hypothetical protein
VNDRLVLHDRPHQLLPPQLLSPGPPPSLWESRSPVESATIPFLTLGFSPSSSLIWLGIYETNRSVGRFLGFSPEITKWLWRFFVDLGHCVALAWCHDGSSSHADIIYYQRKVDIILPELMDCIMQSSKNYARFLTLWALARLTELCCVSRKFIIQTKPNKFKKCESFRGAKCEVKKRLIWHRRTRTVTNTFQRFLGSFLENTKIDFDSLENNGKLGYRQEFCETPGEWQ